MYHQKIENWKIVITLYLLVWGRGTCGALHLEDQHYYRLKLVSLQGIFYVGAAAVDKAVQSVAAKHLLLLAA